MKTFKYIHFAIALLLTNNICVAQKQLTKIDSLNEILALQFYEMKWRSCVRTASSILSLDTNAVEVYAARGISYFNLKDRLKPDFGKKNSKKTRQYLTLINLAKVDLEKVIYSNSTIITGDIEFKEKVKNNLDSCNLLLYKYQR